MLVPSRFVRFTTRPSLGFLLCLGLGCTTPDSPVPQSEEEDPGPGQPEMRPPRPDARVADTATTPDAPPAGQLDAASPDAGPVADAALAQDGTSSADGASPAATDGGVVAEGSSRCATSGLPICLDFESGALPAGWTSSNASNPKVDPGRAARGTHSLHFARLNTGSRFRITTTQLPGITNVMWGRYFLYITPGAPNGHGALVNAYDQSGNFYEMGFQFGNYHGNWHVPSGVPERWMNSTVKIPGGRWVCVEWRFDGATPDVARIYSDGQEVKYSQSATRPGPLKVARFTKVEIGFIPFHGSTTTDMWLDEIALAPERIGCER